MDEFFARVSKAGRVVCGKQHEDGGFYCDEPVAAIVRVHEPPRYPERRLAALPGWRMDRKGIWRRTTSVEDRRAHGHSGAKSGDPTSPELPALVCCPKCGTLQWLDAERLGVVAKTGGQEPGRSRWLIRSDEFAPPREGVAAFRRHPKGGER